MATHSQTPFSLRPWPTRDKKPQNLAEFIARVNAQPGGFRGLNEAELRQDVEAKKRGTLEDGGVDGSDDEEEDDDEADEAKRKNALVAREEFLRNIESV